MINKKLLFIDIVGFIVILVLFLIVHVRFYDVVVVGGEPEAVAAALSSARNDLDTILITKDKDLGGLMTLGELNYLDMNYNKDNSVLLTQGIFLELYNELGNAFDIETGKAWFMDKCNAESNLSVITSCESYSPFVIKNKIICLKADNKYYFGKKYIDSTADADIAAMAGCSYTIGAEEFGNSNDIQASTLIFELSGINWDSVIDYLNNDPYPGTGGFGKTSWGYTQEMKGFVPDNKDIKMRGLNIARLDNGNCLINGLLIFNVDGLNEESKALGIKKAEEELPNIIKYFKENLTGFENAEYAGHAESLYIRETRHLIGLSRLTLNDVLENTYKEDQIAIGSYPVDIQTINIDKEPRVLGDPEQYSISYGSMVPIEISNLLVASRSGSYDSLAFGSARVIPVGMCVAQAAGVACKYSIDNKISFAAINEDINAIHNIQNMLKNQGAYLEEFNIPATDNMKHWAYSGIRNLRSISLLDCNYKNDYFLEDEITDISELTQRLEKLLHKEIILPDSYDLTINSVISIIANNMKNSNFDYDTAFEELKKDNIIDNTFIANAHEFTSICTKAELYYLLGKLY